MTRVLPLSDVRAGHAPVVGGKAARLGELLSAGFPVPDGFVALPECPSEAILGALASVAGDRYAVRSSGVAEDGADASWAGQLTTELDVAAPDVPGAVARCRASADAPIAQAYAESHGVDGVAVPVLVQEMVDAEAAGVAFSANPLSGNRGEVVVHAVPGLGDRLTSGEASPEAWTVTDLDARLVEGGQDVLSTAQARDVADLARRCAALFGAPQDIEWAIADGRLRLLQSRPITALPDPPAVIPLDVPPGLYWELEDVHFPQPLSPAARWMLPNHNRVFSRLFAEYGILAEGLEHVEIGGRVYVTVVPLGGSLPRFPPPVWLMRLLMPWLARLSAPLRERIAAARRMLREDRASKVLDRWERTGRAEARAANAELLAVPLAELTAPELADHLSRVVRHACEAVHLHMELSVVVHLSVATAAFFCRDHLGWEARDAVRLLIGHSPASTQPGFGLAPLAAHARQRPAVMAILADPGEDPVTRLEAADPEFAAAFQRWLAEHGCRALRYDVIDPCLDECPALVARLIHAQVVRAVDPDAVAAGAAERCQAARGEARGRLEPALREEFDRLLTRAERAYGVREDNERDLVSAPLAILRKALLAAGRRLVAAGVLAARDDVFLLEVDEVRAALRDRASRTDLVARRRAERAWAQHADPPQAFGDDPGGIEALERLAPEARFPTEVLVWATKGDMVARPSTLEGGTLVGQAGSKGTYAGSVRVVRHEREFDKVQPGDVLVCRIPAPVWSVLFGSIGALVTDAGGVISHGAIIAREYGIPAVLGTGSATTALRDGQIVRVDGNLGVVEVLA